VSAALIAGVRTADIAQPGTQPATTREAGSAVLEHLRRAAG
jgi:hypothetical protein